MTDEPNSLHDVKAAQKRVRGLAERKLAMAYLRRNPQATSAEVAEAVVCSEKTVVNARRDLVKSGELPRTRRARTAPAPPTSTDATEGGAGTAQPTVPDRNIILDGEQLALLAAGDMTLADEADPETRKKMLQALRGIAFSPLTHDDTRVNAMKAWFALKDSLAARELGPGVPKTEESALSRLTDLNTAVGLKLAIRSIIKAFGLMPVLTCIEALFSRKETPDAGELPDHTDEAAPDAPGTAPAPGSPPDVHDDEGSTGS